MSSAIANPTLSFCNERAFINFASLFILISCFEVAIMQANFVLAHIFLTRHFLCIVELSYLIIRNSFVQLIACLCKLLLQGGLFQTRVKHLAVFNQWARLSLTLKNWSCCWTWRNHLTC